MGFHVGIRVAKLPRKHLRGDRPAINGSLTISVLTPLTKGLPGGGPNPFWAPCGGANRLIAQRFRPRGRPSKPGGSVPRLRPDPARAAFRLGAFVLAMALPAGAPAQTSPPAIPENGTFDPPGGQGVLDPEGAEQSSPLIRRNAPTFGNPPASGAGKTGFDSTGARRKLQSAIGQKEGRGQPLPRVVTTPTAPVQRLPPAAAPPPVLPDDPVVVSAMPPPQAPPRARPKPKPPELDPYAPLGIRAGSFILRPAIDITGGYDSNPARNSRPEGSPFYVIAPELQAKSDWERHELRARIRGSYEGYTEQ